jgi:hypothetical protein
MILDRSPNQANKQKHLTRLVKERENKYVYMVRWLLTDAWSTNSRGWRMAAVGQKLARFDHICCKGHKVTSFHSPLLLGESSRQKLKGFPDLQEDFP